MSIKRSNKIAHVQEYYFSKKLREIRAMNSAGKNVLNLGIGSPDLAPHQEVIKTIVESASLSGSHGYQPYKGVDELRLAISSYLSKFYGVELNSNTEILPLLGSKEGITHIATALVSDGDKVLVPNPGYPTYESVSRIAGAEVLFYDLEDSEEGFQPNVDQIEELAEQGAKLLWLNYPNMPTGSKEDKTRLKRIIDIASRCGMAIVNDNPYSQILTDEVFSIFQIDGAKAVCLELNSLSKSHNMAGWRVGWLAGNEDLISKVLIAKSNVDSGMFLPVQMAAVKALNLGQDWFDSLNEVYKERRQKVYELLNELKCEYSKNQVGMFVWAKVPKEVGSVEEYVDDLIEKAQVFITPGFIFGSQGDGFIRISLCSSIDIIDESIGRIKKMKLNLVER